MNLVRSGDEIIVKDIPKLVFFIGALVSILFTAATFSLFWVAYSRPFVMFGSDGNGGIGSWTAVVAFTLSMLFLVGGVAVGLRLLFSPVYTLTLNSRSRLATVVKSNFISRDESRFPFSQISGFSAVKRFDHEEDAKMLRLELANGKEVPLEIQLPFEPEGTQLVAELNSLISENRTLG